VSPGSARTGEASAGGSAASVARSRLGGVARRDAVLLGRRWLASYPTRLALVVALYAGSATVGYQLSFGGPVAAIVWLPVGVGIAALFRLGIGLWPGVLVGDLLINDYGRLPLGSAVGQSVGNVVEVVLAVVLLRRAWARHDTLLGNVRGLRATVLALAVATATSATIGIVVLRLGGVVATGDVVRAWRTWWLGDLAGALVVVPAVIAWTAPPAVAERRVRALEAGALVAAVAALTLVSYPMRHAALFLVFPALMWTALRGSQRLTASAIATTAVVSLWGTVHYHGPFDLGARGSAVVNAQVFIAVASLSTLCLAAVVAERETFARRVGIMRGRMLRAADEERSRIERNLHDGAQQRLLALGIRLRAAVERAERDAPAAARLLGDAEAELLRAIDELRQLAHGAHPDLLTTVGLPRAIEDLAAHASVPVAVVGSPARADSATEATAYYVVAEALANAQKFASASAIAIRVTHAGDGLYVKVHDDGVGGARARPGSGLDGLRRRLEQTGGTLRVESEPGAGTTVSAVIPAPLEPV
jgi:signal transduction histidine kinase